MAAVRLPAQQATPPLDDKVITNAQVFWALSNEEKSRPHHVRFEVLVYYYDPIWQLIWGECDGAGSFLPVRGEPLPIKTGQRVRLEGAIIPSRGILRSEITVTVLEENALPEPIPTKGNLTDWARLESRWSSLEGFVCRQTEVDRSHILYEVLTDGWLVTVRVLVNESEPVPQLSFTHARFNGVYIADRDAIGALRAISYWVPRLKDVTMLGELSSDARFALPRTPLDQLGHADKTGWVRLVGEVREFNPGQNLILRDDSGQLTIVTPQPAKLQVGDRLEVVGRVAGEGLNLTLTEPLFRPLALRVEQGAIQGGDGAPRTNLRVVEQVLELAPAEVARGYPVTLKGVVTWASPHERYFYVQDATGGICVWREPSVESPATGTAVAIEGKTFSGRYAPEIKLLAVTPFGSLAPPRAIPLTLEQAMIGAEEAKLVQIRGYLRQAVKDGDWTRLDLTTASGEFSAYAEADDYYATLTGAIVQMAGVCSVTADNQRQLTGLRLWIPGRESVAVEQPPPTDPFSAPHFTITGLKQFSGAGAFNRRVMVSGALISQVPGSYLLLQDGESGLMIFSRDPAALAIGSAVEVTGLPGREGSRVVLREGMVRPAKTAQSVSPLTLESFKEPKTELDSRLVRVRAVLSQFLPQKNAVRLTMQGEGVIFDAVLNQAANWKTPEPGSQLELTGVYLVEYDASRRPRGFRLELRTPADVRVLSTPTWWTASRAFAVAGGLAVCTLLGLGWVTVLRRRVKEQTEQIRLQMDKEAGMQAELERATRLDSLGVLAGGIAHDFNNLLTAIRGNLGLIQMEPEVMKVVGDQVNGAEKAAKRATDVTQQLLTFAKGGDPVRGVVDMAELVREAAGFARHGSNVLVEFNLADDLPPAEVDASQISRVVHNLVLNAVQALSGGGVVRLVLNACTLQSGEISALAAGRYLLLVVADNGPGIPAERLPRIFDPYFSTKVRGSGLGLATCHSIVKKHLGQIEVKSSPAVGTTFYIWLPAAVPVAPKNKSITYVPFTVASARILFMDDDEVVRNLAKALLARAGHDGTLVADGAEAVAAFRQARAAGNPYDLAIFDLTVPGGMGGKEALAEILKIDPGVQVIASSGYSNDPVMANHQAFGFVAVLPKPYTFDAFTRAINRVRRQAGGEVASR